MRDAGVCIEESGFGVHKQDDGDAAFHEPLETLASQAPELKRKTVGSLVKSRSSDRAAQCAGCAQMVLTFERP